MPTKTRTVFALAVPLFAIFFLLGCDPLALTGTRLTTSPARVGASATTSSPATADPQEPLAAVDSILTANGLFLWTNNVPTINGRCAVYLKTNWNSPFDCSVYEGTNDITAVFREHGRFKPSPMVTELNDTLQQKLAELYGAENVEPLKRSRKH